MNTYSEVNLPIHHLAEHTRISLPLLHASFLQEHPTKPQTPLSTSMSGSIHRMLQQVKFFFMSPQPAGSLMDTASSKLAWMNACLCLGAVITSLPSLECFYDKPPSMPATVSKPIPRLFSLILIFLLVRPVYEDVIVNTSLSRIFFFDLAACSGEYGLFYGSCNRRFGGGLS